jgi:hypothetical protein
VSFLIIEDLIPSQPMLQHLVGYDHYIQKKAASALQAAEWKKRRGKGKVRRLPDVPPTLST